MKVVAFSENEEVELFVNGKSVGRKPVSRATEYKAEFWIRYVSGELEAVGFVRGKPVSHWTLKSAGNPATVRLTVDRPKIHGDGDDLAYITAELLDDKNVPTYKRTSDRLLHFSVRGAGTLAGGGNGNPMAVESSKAVHARHSMGAPLPWCAQAKFPAMWWSRFPLMSYRRRLLLL